MNYKIEKKVDDLSKEAACTLDLSFDFNGVNFKNPVIAASGTFGFGKEYAKEYDLNLLGGISTKGTTLKPKSGNIGVRCMETPSGMMNSVGLENPGMDSFIKDELPFLAGLDTAILANIGGNDIDDYVTAVAMVDKAQGVDVIELNISCPNVAHGGMAFGMEPACAKEVVKEVRAVTSLPLMVKLSPNAHNLVAVVVAVEEAGADAVSLVNTFSAMKIDIRKRQSAFKNLYAGLSGPAIRPIAVRMVNEVYKAVSIPVCGLGGIVNGEDAIEFIMAGASLVQVGTANFMRPDACIKVIDGISSFMKKEGIKDLSEIRGVVK